MNEIKNINSPDEEHQNLNLKMKKSFRSRNRLNMKAVGIEPNSSRVRKVDYQRHYKKAWEDLPELRGWITPVTGNPQRACCRYCRISLRAHRRDLVDHSLTERHVRNANDNSHVVTGNSDDRQSVETFSDITEEVDSLSDNTPGDMTAYCASLQLSGELSAADYLDGATYSTQRRNVLSPTSVTRLAKAIAPQVMVIQTGGTIDKDYPKTKLGYAFEIGDAATVRIFDRIGLGLPVFFKTVYRKDSQEITDDDRFLLCQYCAGVPQKRLLITHGTDTMLETATYLAAFALLSEKTIVLTGAFKPERLKDSDADFNVGCALGAVQTLPCPGVYIVMHGVVAKYDEIERDRRTGQFIRKCVDYCMNS